MAFVHRLRVRYHECDAQGVVFNANHFAYFDVALTELWRAAFGSYGAMLEQGLDLVVAEVTARFRRPAVRLVTSPSPGTALYLATSTGRLYALSARGRWYDSGVAPGLRAATFVG